MQTNSTDYGPRDLIGYGADTPNPQWPGGAKIAINLVLNYEEGSEVTPVNGDNVTETAASEVSTYSLSESLMSEVECCRWDLAKHR